MAGKRRDMVKEVRGRTYGGSDTIMGHLLNCEPLTYRKMREIEKYNYEVEYQRQCTLNKKNFRAI